MPSRLHKSRPFSFHRSRDSDASTNQQNKENETPKQTTPPDESHRTALAPAPNSATNTQSRGEGMTMADAKYISYANSPKSANSNIPSTIRTIPSFDAPSDASSEPPSMRSSGFSSSINSNVSGTSDFSQSQNGNAYSTRPVMASSETLKASDGAAESSPLSLQVPDMDDPSRGVRETSPQWDGAVGKAALGKTGRVINKLVSDNEALKRDIKVERMKAEEFKQTAKLMEDKMERTVSDYESRLLEANVTKTLLSRKERQVETLQASVDLEKKRAVSALERERVWKEEMERARRDATIQVEEAKAHVALVDGRYNSIASHWKDQGAVVDKKTAGLRKEIAELVDERQKDDERINTLRDLCDQQDGNLRDLMRQKDLIAEQFERYKAEQEALLHDIKRRAANREEQQQQNLDDSKEVLDKLRWALNVKKNVPGAE